MKMLVITCHAINHLFTNLYYVKVTKDDDLIFKRFQNEGTYPALCQKFHI